MGKVMEKWENLIGAYFFDFMGFNGDLMVV